jgi:hypothetical protein
MANLRLISADLLNSVADKISQDLGYRYYGVYVPVIGWLNPKPKVTDATGKYFPDSTLAKWLGVLDSLPNKVFQIRIPKVINGEAINESNLRTGENWKMTLENESEVNIKVLDIESKNSHYLVTAGVIKGKI